MHIMVDTLKSFQINESLYSVYKRLTYKPEINEKKSLYSVYKRLAYKPEINEKNLYLTHDYVF